MKKKGCLKFLLVVISIFVLLFVWIMRDQNLKVENAELDAIKESKICDTIKFITEQPQITFSDFTPDEIERIQFYLIRDNEIVEHNDVWQCEYSSYDETYKRFKIPFKSFLKTDTIIVKTSNQYFKIPQFHHYAYLHYGNFGYLGSSECRIEDNKKLTKLDGVTENILPKKASH